MKSQLRSDRLGLSLMVALVLLASNAAAQVREGQSMLLDDFSRSDGQALIGTQWEGFTDRVMGGRSDMDARVVSTEDGPAIHMTGRVTTENNGGFIQVRLPLSEHGHLDASAYRGVALSVRGSGDNYYVHLRTNRTRFPWAHYARKLPVTEQWQRVELPFEEFEGQLMLGGRRVDTDRLRSIAVVAAKADFQADIWVREVSLY
ncbi:MAG: NADH:ubiquinone oxidoreductase [Spirochaetaceae bacterium]|nr:MAG: NADH:ubiquinone oxidoreductase [Spirochaetaceae bacterium]